MSTQPSERLAPGLSSLISGYLSFRTFELQAAEVFDQLQHNGVTKVYCQKGSSSSSIFPAHTYANAYCQCEGGQGLFLPEVLSQCQIAASDCSASHSILSYRFLQAPLSDEVRRLGTCWCPRAELTARTVSMITNVMTTCTPGVTRRTVPLEFL